MKKTLKFLKEHKQFTFFGILAILIILAADLCTAADRWCGSVEGLADRSTGSTRARNISLELIKWGVIFMPV